MSRTTSLARRRSNSASTSPPKSVRSKPTTRSWTGPSGMTVASSSAAQHLALRHLELLRRQNAVVVERLQPLELFDDVGRERRPRLGRADDRLPLGRELLSAR